MMKNYLTADMHPRGPRKLSDLPKSIPEDQPTRRRQRPVQTVSGRTEKK